MSARSIGRACGVVIQCNRCGAKVQTALSYGMYFVLAACAASFMYGAAEFGWARKRNRHGEMNEGKAVCGWSLAGAAVASMAIALVNLAFG